MSAGQIAAEERLKQKQREARERPRTAPPGPGPGSHTPKVERHRAPAFFGYDAELGEKGILTDEVRVFMADSIVVKTRRKQ